MTIVLVTKSAQQQILHQLHFVMSDQLVKYELHICKDSLFIYNLIVKLWRFYPTNLVFKQNSRSLHKGDSLTNGLKIYVAARYHFERNFKAQICNTGDKNDASYLR